LATFDECGLLVIEKVFTDQEIGALAPNGPQLWPDDAAEGERWRRKA